jgi:AP-2 complex subunit alpha
MPAREPQKLFDTLNKHYQLASEKARCMLLNAFVKLASKYAELRDQVQMIFMVSAEHFDPDLQQRGIEYNSLLQEAQDIQNKVFEKQPPYSEDIQNNNPLIKRIYKLKLTGLQTIKDPSVAREVEKQVKEGLE